MLKLLLLGKTHAIENLVSIAEEKLEVIIGLLFYVSSISDNQFIAEMV